MYGKGGQVTAKVERLTNTSVKRLAYARDGAAYIVRDSDLGGFHVRVTSRVKVYKFTTDTVEAGKRRTLGFTLGNAADVQADAARLAAEDLTRQRKLGSLLARRNTTAAPDRLDLTLGAGWQHYRETLIRERKSPKTIKFYQAVMGNHLAHWADTPL